MLVGERDHTWTSQDQTRTRKCGRIRPMSRKRLSKQEQKDIDVEHLNDAIEELMEQAASKVPGAETDLQRQAIQSKLRLDAIKALPALLERKAALLGLDDDGKGTAADQPGSIASVTRRLEAIQGGKGE